MVGECDDTDADLGRVDRRPDPSAGWGLRAYGAMLPRYPDERMVPLITIPAPPLLPAGSDVERVAFMLSTYAGARQTHYKVGYRPSTHVEKLRYYPALCTAARLLGDAKLQPAVWAMFSFSAWDRITANKPVGAYNGAAPAQWVFAPKRMTDHNNGVAICAATGRWASAQSRMHPAHTDLCHAWEAARKALDSLPVGATIGEAEAAIGPALDGWSDRIRFAARRVATYQNALLDGIARGRWVWS